MATLFGHLEPATYRRHPLHAPERDWPETNCYLDIWVEVLATLGLPPEAALGFAIRQDFEGDQFTFFKVPLEDLEILFGIQATELAIWEPVERHVAVQIGRGRLCLVEVDGYFLPDTRGAGYRQTHGKTTIAINRLDPAAREMDYWHNLGLHRLSGEDFDGVFQHGRLQPGFRFLPYTEFVKFPDRYPSAATIRALAEDLLDTHVAARPAANPIRAFQAMLPTAVAELAGRDFDAFHLFAFNTLRQVGANFELFSAHLAWLRDGGSCGLAGLAEEAAAISSVAKSTQFLLARAVARGRGQGVADALTPAADAWDRLVDGLVARHGGAARAA